MKKIWKICSKDDLYKILNCEEKEITLALTEKKKYYDSFIAIPKKNGVRKICVVNKTCKLYYLQKRLKSKLLDNIMLSDVAFGFVKKAQYLDYLENHKEYFQRKNYLRIDITDFFGSIKEEHVRKAFENIVCEGEDKDSIVDLLVQIVMNGNRLEQGTPVAPAISNIIFRPIDIRIERYCDKMHINYSRYVDDLLFSSEDSVVMGKRFFRTLERILGDYGFKVNYQKTKKSTGSICINGYVVDNCIRLSRKKLKPISAVLFYLEGHKYEKNSKWINDYNAFMKTYGIKAGRGIDIINYLAGNRAFLINAKRYSDNKNSLEKTIKRIEKQITIIEAAI